ncbi:hypothetical protein [Pontibacter rugosus]
MRLRGTTVRVKPETGRMHQIRKHFAHIRHYIVGDKRHGDWRHNKMFLEELDSSFLLLHAAELSFLHPFTGQQVSIKPRCRRTCYGYALILGGMMYWRNSRHFLSQYLYL